MANVIVHVNQHVIRHNAKHGTSYPTLTIKLPEAAHFRRSRNCPGTIYAHEVGGIGRVVDINAAGRKPLSCGARVWMEFAPDTFFVEGSWMDFNCLRALMFGQEGETPETPETTALAGAIRE